MPSQTIEAEGHLIDSGDLQGILTTIVEHGATYEIERLDVGRTNADASRLTITVAADSATSLEHLLEKLSPETRARVIQWIDSKRAKTVILVDKNHYDIFSLPR